MPIPSKIKEMPSRRVVKKDFSTPKAFDKSLSPEGLRVLAHVHNYPPTALTGGAFTMHHLLKFGAGRGWIPRVVTDHPPVRADAFQGVPVRRDNNVRTVTPEYRLANVIITHLNVTRKAVDLSRRAGKPLVHLIHNPAQIAQYNIKEREAALLVFNSAWLRAETDWQRANVVLHPLVPVGDYRVEETGDAVTMVNLTDFKGAPMFYELAAKNPSVRFIGVKSTYGKQLVAPNLPNLDIWEPLEDIRDLYRETRVLLMPSQRETWGRVAVEAACSGIPSICSTTPGLLETGVAAVNIDYDDVEKWNKAVRRLTRGPKAWEEESEKAYARALELDEIVRQEAVEACLAIEALA